MIIPAVYVHCGFGLILTAISLPLALRRVPMNELYGVRLPASFKSDETWYDINAYSGRVLSAFGILMIVLGYLCRGLAPPQWSPWYGVFTVAPLLTTFVPIAFVLVYARRRAREG